MADLTFTITFKDDGTPVLKNIQRSVEETGSKIEGATRGAASGMDSMAAKARTAAAAIGAMAGVTSVASIVALARNVLNAADAISDLSDQSGLSIQTLLGLQQTTAKYGVSVQEAALGVRFMQRSLVESISNVDKANDPLRRLGFTTQELLRLSSDPDGFLLAFAQKLAAIENPAERMSLAMEAASRAGGRLGPVLLDVAQNGLPQVTQETIQAYKRLGELADRLAVVAAKAADFTITIAARIGTGLGLLQRSISEIKRDLDQTLKFSPGDIGAIDKLKTELAAAEALEKKANDVAKASLTPSALDGAKQVDLVKQLTESLEKQAIGLEAQRIALIHGEAAALRYNLTQSALAELGGTVVPAAIAKAIDKVVGLANAIKQDELAMRSLFATAKEQALPTEEEEGPSFLSGTVGAARERSREISELLEQARKSAASVERSLTDDLGTEVQRRIAAATQERDERLRLINDWQVKALTAGKNVSDQAARLREMTDQSFLQKTDVGSRLQRQFGNIDIAASVLGPDFDSIGPKIRAVGDALIDLVEQRQRLAEQAQREFVVDPARAAATAAEIAKLSGQIDTLSESLAKLREAERVREAIEGIADGISSAFDRALNSTGTILERLKNLANDVLGTINREITKLLITDPIKEWLRHQIGGIAGQIGLPVPGPAGTPGTIGANGASTAGVAAIQSTQTAAVAAIDAQSTVSQTGLQGLITLGETSINATQSVAVTAIESIQAVAIAAIEAAAAQAAATTNSNTPGGGGLFGLFGGSTTTTSNAPTSTMAGSFDVENMMWGASVAHRGGVAGDGDLPTRLVDATIFGTARRYEQGGMPGLEPGEVPVIAHRGERILNAEETRRYDSRTGGRGERRATQVINHFHGIKDMPSFTRSARSIEGDMIRAIRNAQRRRGD